MPGLASRTCEKPGCENQGMKTYKDANGNRLKLCSEHYYNQVTGGVSLLGSSSEK